MAYNEINCKIADILGVDRRVHRSVAEAVVGGDYCYGGNGNGEFDVEIPAGYPIPEGFRRSYPDTTEPRLSRCVLLRIPPGDTLSPVQIERSGGHPYNARYSAFVGRWLAERYSEVAMKIENYRGPPKPYSSDWTVFMEEVRPWIASQPLGVRERWFFEIDECAGFLNFTPEQGCLALLAVAK